MNTFRPVLVLILAVWFLQLAGGTLSVIVPLGLSTLGADPTEIGIIAALYAAGMMFGAYVAPRLVGRTGNIRTFSAAAALTLIGSLLLSYAPPVWLWAPIRILQGIGFAAMFASAEAWLGQAAPKEQRGSVLGAYNVAAKAALMTGPFLVAGAAALAPSSFVLTGLFLACALIPVCLTQQVEPERMESRGLPVREIFRSAPAAFMACLMAGIINGGTFALLPLFAMAALDGVEPVAAAALAFAAANAGGLVAQWPLGRLSDRFDRRVVIAAQSALAALPALLLALFGAGWSNLAVLAMLFIWGAGSLTFYGIAVAHGIDRMQDGPVAGLMGVLIISWATGSVLGPLFAGVVVGLLPVGASGLYLFTAAGLALLSGLMMIRRQRRVAPVWQGRWHPALPAPVGLMGTRLHKFRKKSRSSGSTTGDPPS